MNSTCVGRMMAHTSNAALAKLTPRVQWEHSYVTGDKTFCVYLAEDEEAIREHAEISGFAANLITQVRDALGNQPAHLPISRRRPHSSRMVTGER